MKFRLLVPGIAALAVLIAACQPPPVLRNDRMLNDLSLITNDPCSAPCWKGITPGETRWSDALTIIEDAPELDDPQTQTAQDSKAVGAQWQKKDGDLCCQMVSEDGETVSFISLTLAPEVRLQGLLDARGEPTYALGQGVTDDQAVVYLFYPEQSLIVIAFVAGTNADLTGQSEIIGALYATQKDMDLTIKTSNLHAWQGYGPFSQYRVDAPVEEFEVTPSITLTPPPG